MGGLPGGSLEARCANALIPWSTPPVGKSAEHAARRYRWQSRPTRVFPLLRQRAWLPPFAQTREAREEPSTRWAAFAIRARASRWYHEKLSSGPLITRVATHQ